MVDSNLYVSASMKEQEMSEVVNMLLLVYISMFYQQSTTTMLRDYYNCKQLITSNSIVFDLFSCFHFSVKNKYTTDG